MRKIGAFAPSSSVPENNIFPDLALLEKPFLNVPRRKLNSRERKLQEETNQNSDKNANLNVANYAKEGNPVDFNCNPSDIEDRKLATSVESEDFIVVILLIYILFIQL